MEGCLEWRGVLGLRGEVQLSNLRRQVMDFGGEVLESACDVDAQLKRGVE